MSAPIGYTCPDIDSIQDASKEVDDILGKLTTEFSNLYSELNGKHSTFESLRKANEMLRQWGSEQEDRADDLEAEVERLREENAELSSRVRSLED